MVFFPKVYIGVAADIIEFFEVFKEARVGVLTKKQLEFHCFLFVTGSYQYDIEHFGSRFVDIEFATILSCSNRFTSSQESCWFSTASF